MGWLTVREGERHSQKQMAVLFWYLKRINQKSCDLCQCFPCDSHIIAANDSNVLIRVWKLHCTTIFQWHVCQSDSWFQIDNNNFPRVWMASEMNPFHTPLLDLACRYPVSNLCFTFVVCVLTHLSYIQPCHISTLPSAKWFLTQLIFVSKILLI